MGVGKWAFKFSSNSCPFIAYSCSCRLVAMVMHKLGLPLLFIRTKIQFLLSAFVPQCFTWPLTFVTLVCFFFLLKVLPFWLRLNFLFFLSSWFWVQITFLACGHEITPHWMALSAKDQILEIATQWKTVPFVFQLKVKSSQQASFGARPFLLAIFWRMVWET